MQVMGTITPELQYLADQLLALSPGSKLGGIYAFKPGYHSTRADNQANWPGNYSIIDDVDRNGPSDKAAAIDWTFPDAQAGNYATIDRYSSRLLASGQDPDDDRLNGWREFYGQCDNDQGVEGWDFRYVVAATSDSSHLWHIHLSCDRDKVNSRENMDKLLSVLRGDDMALTSDDCEKLADYLAKDSEFLNAIVNAVFHRDGEPALAGKYFPWRADSPAHVPPGTNEWVTGGTGVIEAAQQANKAHELAKANAAALARIEAVLASGVPIPGEVVLTAESVADVADAVADEIRADPERDGP